MTSSRLLVVAVYWSLLLTQRLTEHRQNIVPKPEVSFEA
jgi:hypothetical protein